MSLTAPVVVSQTLRRRRGLTEQAAVAGRGPSLPPAAPAHHPGSAR